VARNRCCRGSEEARRCGRRLHGGIVGGKVLDVRYHIIWRESWKRDQM
jgi:hypothetical protein